MTNLVQSEGNPDFCPMTKRRSFRDKADFRHGLICYQEEKQPEKGAHTKKRAEVEEALKK